MVVITWQFGHNDRSKGSKAREMFTLGLRHPGRQHEVHNLCACTLWLNRIVSLGMDWAGQLLWKLQRSLLCSLEGWVLPVPYQSFQGELWSIFLLISKKSKPIWLWIELRWILSFAWPTQVLWSDHRWSLGRNKEFLTSIKPFQGEW